MPTITRNEALARIVTTGRILSATWPRRVDKFVNRCNACNAETASHKGVKVCNRCNDNVNTHRSLEAEAGDLIRMQFIPKIATPDSAPMKSKNFTGVGGNIFNAPTFEAGQEKLRQKGLIQCWKMGEQVPTDDAGDLRRLVSAGSLPAVPRTLPIPDLETITFDGTTYDITDN